MPFWIVREDITRMRVDAIVNAAKPSLLGGGGVDGAIHAAAGSELLAACRALGGCPVGQVRLTPGFRLPAKYVIHAVGPKWHGGLFGEREKLLSCYRSALELAAELGCESLAFPLISSGAYGYPKDKALTVAREAIEDFLREREMNVYLTIYGQESLAASRKLFREIREYIDDRYVESHSFYANRPGRRREDEDQWSPAESAAWDGEQAFPAAPAPEQGRKKRRDQAAPMPQMAAPMPQMPMSAPSGWVYGELDESFQQMLLRRIDESGMTDAQCYKRANVDRKLFSKIRKDVLYKPSKPTALAFAVALRLNLRDTRELLAKAGYALSRSSKFDLIVQYFIEHGNYDIFAINEALFAFDQALLGNSSQF